MRLPDPIAGLWIKFVAVLYLVLGPLIALFALLVPFIMSNQELLLYNRWAVSRPVFIGYHFIYGIFLLIVSISFFKRYRPVWQLFLVLSLPEHFTWLAAVALPWSLVIVFIELAAWTMTVLSWPLFPSEKRDYSLPML